MQTIPRKYLLILFIVIIVIFFIILLFLLIKKRPAKFAGKFKFEPFGKNICYGDKCPSESELNPGFYKICWFRLGTAKCLKTCSQEGLINAIIDNYNCISPSISSLNFDLDGKVTVSKDFVEETDYFVELANKVVNIAASRGKLIVITPNLILGELYKYYMNAKNDKYFNDLYNVVTRFDKTFIKGIVYDTEYWDDNNDKNGTSTDCFDHSHNSHSGHRHCFVKYIGEYFNVIAKKWAIKEPGWEVYINDFLDSDLLEGDENSPLVQVLKNNANLGFQNQSYTFCAGDNPSSSDEKLARLLKSRKKLVWGGAGYQGSGGSFDKQEIEQCMGKAKKMGYYGFFIFGGICYLAKNKMINCSPGFNCYYQGGNRDKC